MIEDFAHQQSKAIHPSRWGRLLSKAEVAQIQAFTPTELDVLLDFLDRGGTILCSPAQWYDHYPWDEMR